MTIESIEAKLDLILAKLEQPTAVAAQTDPTTPVIVNVKLCPSPRLVAPLLHPNSVPLPVLATVAAPQVAGWSDANGVVTTANLITNTTY